MQQDQPNHKKTNGDPEHQGIDTQFLWQEEWDAPWDWDAHERYLAQWAGDEIPNGEHDGFNEMKHELEQFVWQEEWDAEWDWDAHDEYLRRWAGEELTDDERESRDMDTHDEAGIELYHEEDSDSDYHQSAEKRVKIFEAWLQQHSKYFDTYILKKPTIARISPTIQARPANVQLSPGMSVAALETRENWIRSYFDGANAWINICNDEGQVLEKLQDAEEQHRLVNLDDRTCDAAGECQRVRRGDWMCPWVIEKPRSATSKRHSGKVAVPLSDNFRGVDVRVRDRGSVLEPGNDCNYDGAVAFDIVPQIGGVFEAEVQFHRSDRGCRQCMVGAIPMMAAGWEEANWEILFAQGCVEQAPLVYERRPKRATRDDDADDVDDYDDDDDDDHDEAPRVLLRLDWAAGTFEIEVDGNFLQRFSEVPLDFIPALSVGRAHNSVSVLWSTVHSHDTVVIEVDCLPALQGDTFARRFICTNSMSGRVVAETVLEGDSIARELRAFVAERLQVSKARVVLLKKGCQNRCKDVDFLGTEHAAQDRDDSPARKRSDSPLPEPDSFKRCRKS